MDKVKDQFNWKCKHLKIRKYKDANAKEPYEVTTIEGNLITNNGLKTLWRAITGMTTNQVVEGTGGWFDFRASQLYIGVGNNLGSTALESNVTDVRLNGDEQDYVLINQESGITYIDSDINGPQIKIEATFDGQTGNFPWYEWGVFNGNPNSPGNRTNPTDASSNPGVDYNIVMLNHKIEAMGVKPLGAVWIAEAVFQLQNGS